MRQTVVIEADRTRHMRLGFNQLVELEDTLGRPITELNNNIGIKDMRAILYVALKQDDPTLTLDQTGDIIDEIIEKNSIEYLTTKLTEVMEQSFGNSNASQSVEMGFTNHNQYR